MTAFGIDLGTTYSCVARVDDTGRAVVLPNAVGEDTTPSVVYFESADQVVVGRAAKDSAILAPDLIAQLVKRDMGSDDVHWTYHGQRHTPESVSGIILRELARAASEASGEQVHDVVITVPAYFGLAEKEATRRAGQIAGLNVLDVLAEPVAAALHYQALNDTGADRYLLVYDLGGGTFDTTVIRLSGQDVQVVCTDGDHKLGGADWDTAIMEYLLAEFAAQQPDIDPGSDEQGMQDLAAAVERLKKDLSQTQSRKVPVRFGGKAAQVEVTRAKLEEITQVLLERTMEITERTIATAKDKGVAAVRRRAAGRRDDPDAGRQDHAGRAVQGGSAAARARPGRGQGRGPVRGGQAGQGQHAGRRHAGPGAAGRPAGRRPAGTERGAGRGTGRKAGRHGSAAGVRPQDHRPQGSSVQDRPGAREQPDRPPADGQHRRCPRTPGRSPSTPWWTTRPRSCSRSGSRPGSIASDQLEHNTHIGQGLLAGLPPRPAGAAFDVTFYMTESGLLKVHGAEKKSGREVRFEIQIGGLTEDEVREAEQAVSRYAISG